MGFLDAIFGKRQPPSRSASVAKQRLVEVLVYDHVKVTPQTMDAIRSEISQVLQRHLDIDPSEVQVNITRSENGENFVANVPVKRMVESR